MASDSEEAVVSEPSPESSDPPTDFAENLIWIFGAPRSGTSWLGWMMGDLPRHQLWNEPYVGALFGEFYYRHNGDDQAADFILAPEHRDLWMGHLRALIIDCASIRYPDSVQDGYLVVKEPHGCYGATLVSQALPESRLILLLRDPRDVIASNFDSQRKGSWGLMNEGKHWARPVPAGVNPAAWVRQAAMNYSRYMGIAMSAYGSHPGPKALIKYEELVEDTLATMGRVYSELQIPISERELARVSERHAWERIPPHKKGPKQFFRKGTPGGWKNDLTSEQVETVEKIALPVVGDFYPEVS
jgi:hypothetical protein